MVVPFGFSVGDFITVGKLIGQVAVELRENGEAAPEYQALVIELEALERALCKLQTLRPAKHELCQLTSIRATALACQRPLQDFLGKISKFESKLGTFKAANNRCRGLPRRMQFRIMFKEDVKQLRSALASHVATINLLLMTQAVTSISAAEDDRDRLASGLESKILAQRRLLEDINNNVDTSLNRQQEIKTQLRDQSVALNKLGEKADQTRRQLSGQEASIDEILTTANSTQERTNSLLATATRVLSLLTSGLMQLRQITKQLNIMLRVCATFTTEMRTVMSKLMELFLSLQTMLQRIDRNLPTRLYLPTVQFTTALGETMALPYQLCQQWTTFTELLRVIFLDKPGESRVHMGKYLIMNTRGGRLLGEGLWQHAVQQDDHLSMSIVLDDLTARTNKCPFPSCQASTEGIELENGGRRCRKCGRWSVLALQKRDIPRLPDAPMNQGSDIIKPRRTSTPADEEDAGTDTNSNDSQLHDNEEDIELYRQIHVQYFSTRQPTVRVVSRIVPAHFGVAANFPFEEGKHPESRRVSRVDGDKIEKMQWFTKKGESILNDQLIKFKYSKVVKVTPGIPAHELCATRVHIYRCEKETAPSYKDDPSVKLVMEIEIDPPGFDIPTTWIRGTQFYYLDVALEITFKTAAISACAVYERSPSHAIRFPAKKYHYH